LNWKIISSTTAGVVIGGTMVVLSFCIGDNQTAVVLNLAILCLGFSVGWVIGILISPYDTEESKRFSIYSKAVGVFASGYLVGKIDKLIEHVFDPTFVLDSVRGFRIIAFLSAVIVAMLVTFIYRWYVTIEEKKDDVKQKTHSLEGPEGSSLDTRQK